MKQHHHQPGSEQPDGHNDQPVQEFHGSEDGERHESPLDQKACPIVPEDAPQGNCVDGEERQKTGGIKKSPRKVGCHQAAILDQFLNNQIGVDPDTFPRA
jgi:hypothetical protein